MSLQIVAFFSSLHQEEPLILFCFKFCHIRFCLEMFGSMSPIMADSNGENVERWVVKFDMWSDRGVEV